MSAPQERVEESAAVRIGALCLLLLVVSAVSGVATNVGFLGAEFADNVASQWMFVGPSVIGLAAVPWLLVLRQRVSPSTSAGLATGLVIVGLATLLIDTSATVVAVALTSIKIGFYLNVVLLLYWAWNSRRSSSIALAAAVATMPIAINSLVTLELLDQFVTRRSTLLAVSMVLVAVTGALAARSLGSPLIGESVPDARPARREELANRSLLLGGVVYISSISEPATVNLPNVLAWLAAAIGIATTFGAARERVEADGRVPVDGALLGLCGAGVALHTSALALTSRWYWSEVRVFDSYDESCSGAE